MATRRTVRRVLIVVAARDRVFIVVVVLFTWGEGTGGSGIG